MNYSLGGPGFAYSIVTELVSEIDGQAVTLINVGSSTVEFQDGSIKLAGNFQVNAHDTLQLINNMVVWQELSRSDN